ncbi:MAG: histidine--tRNA ligase [Omnitrophica bacterium GWA2_41_15]|nr:MAG: histidine--tRNA ligase [Omnitrophica bacterium GWA2_41_15]HAZ09789.1 histidine--tRNA ligase [Candidatus Omnitrophota bacterium]
MINALRGTKDILPDEISLWQRIEAIGRDIFNIYGYKEIRTPIIEEASLFIRSIGDATDIVQKEMYVFSDRGNRIIALRPEATASIARAYIENSLFQAGGAAKLFYIGPMFRSERPQQGRQRQFYQIGVEAIGSDNPFIDAEVIALSARFLERLGVKKFHVKLNSLGCQKDKIRVMEKHKESFRPYLEKLCETCKNRFDKNVLRIFDCKEDSCKSIAQNVEAESALCSDCAGHFEKVKVGLNAIGIEYTVDNKIVRGLDYYTRTVFEITQESLGAKDAICAGGRYNNLVKELGGKDTPAIGFAFGMERLVLALEKDSMPHALCSRVNVFVAVTGDALYNEAFKLLDSLRMAGISSEIDYDTKSLKAQMRKAEKLGAKFVVILGEEEFKNKKVVIRDMENSSQKEVELVNLIAELHWVEKQ